MSGSSQSWRQKSWSQWVLREVPRQGSCRAAGRSRLCASNLGGKVFIYAVSTVEIRWTGLPLFYRGYLCFGSLVAH